MFSNFGTLADDVVLVPFRRTCGDFLVKISMAPEDIGCLFRQFNVLAHVLGEKFSCLILNFFAIGMEFLPA